MKSLKRLQVVEPNLKPTIMEYYLDKVFSSLRGTASYEDMVTALFEIKKVLERSENIKTVTTLLHESSHLMEYLMNTLYQPHKDIVEMSLSIFATCVMDKVFSTETLELGHDPWTRRPRVARLFIMPLPESEPVQYQTFLSLLKLVSDRYPKEESIQAKILEIVINVCEHSRVHINQLFNAHDVQQFANQITEWMKCVSSNSAFLQRGITEDTIVVVLRFLKQVLVDRDLQEYIESLDMVKFIGPLFVQATLDAKNNQKIIKEIVAIFFEGRQYDLYLESALNETSDGETIMWACGLMRFFAQRMPGIMEKYMKIDDLDSQSLLPDVCDRIIQTLEGLNIEVHRDDYMGYVCCLCFILLNRCGEQHKKYLPKLIKVLKPIDDSSYADMECFVLIVLLIQKYCCDDAILLKNLLECNLIETLIEQLKWIAGVKTLSLDFNHQMQSKESDSDRIYDGFIRPESCNHPNPTFKKEYSRVTTILPLDNGCEKIFCDGRYSFRDSDSPTNFYKHDWFPNMPCPCTGKSLIDKMKSTLVMEIMNLINIYIDAYPGMVEVASEELMIALMNCCVYFEVYCIGIFQSSPGHMVRLMKTTIIEKLYDMKQKCRDYCLTSHCEVCRRVKGCYEFLDEFGISAKSEKGKELITNELLTSADEQKAQLVVAIPYILSDTFLLAYYLLELDSLKIFEQLLEDDSPYKKRAIKALRVLSSEALHIADRSKVDLAAPLQETIPAPIEMDPLEERLITFVMDDDSSIEVDLNLLTEKSEYFVAMFNGSFKESRLEEVALHKVSKETLQFVLRLLKNPETIDQLVEESTTDFLLEALVFTDRHLLDDLCGSLTALVVKHRMTSESAAAIYRRSIELGLNLLRTEAVTFALVHGSDDEARISMFDGLLEVVSIKDLIGDVRAVLESHLRPLRYSLTE